MSDTNKTLSERDCYRLGRLVFDGADAKWIAVREKIPKKQGQLALTQPSAVSG